MAAKQYPNQEYWRNRLSYDPETGVLTWRNGQCAGREAGCNKKEGGRRVLSMRPGGKRTHYFANKVIWIMIHGHIPNGMVIDHIDGNPGNDRLSNLRCCTLSQNSTNRKAGTHSKTGVMGVTMAKKAPAGLPFRVVIFINRKTVVVGHYSTLREATEVRHQAEREHYGQFAPSLCRK